MLYNTVRTRQLANEVKKMLTLAAFLERGQPKILATARPRGTDSQTEVVDRTHLVLVGPQELRSLMCGGCEMVER